MGKFKCLICNLEFEIDNESYIEGDCICDECCRMVRDDLDDSNIESEGEHE